jgi:hypothetical protein
VSLEFDGEGLDAFDLVTVNEHLPADFELNLTAGPEAIQESALGVPGSVLTCEAVALFGTGAVGTSFSACSVGLQATGVPGAFVLVPGILNAGVDGIFDSLGADAVATTVFTGGTVFVVPESETVGLLAIGLLVLGLSASASRVEEPA